MTAAQKLTKKQKKALAFRERGGKKKSSTTTPSNDDDDALVHGDDALVHGDDDLMEVEDNAIPVMEDQDIADVQSSSVEVEGRETVGKAKRGNSSEKRSGKGKGKDKVPTDEAGLGDATGSSKGKGKDLGKKRKREDNDEDEGERDVVEKQPKKKKAKARDGEEEEDKKAQRFILFVGNLKYTTSKDQILAHFSKVCKPPPTVRLLTPKPKPGVAARPKSKGCAFLEFPTKAPLQEALKLHQSMLDDRMINVELTAGGGGKSEARLSKLRERNKALIGQRIKKVEKGDKSAVLSRPDKPQRYSATSGLDQAEAQMTKRTWSVGDVVEENHRGGKRHQKRGARKPSKSHGTGVNAIPVG